MPGVGGVRSKESVLGVQSEGRGRRAQRGEDYSLCLTSPQGVVPYLGTFLKDLVMLDAASKDELAVSVCSVEG